MKYRDFIKSLPCSVCEDDTTVQQHHGIQMAWIEKGMGVKVPEVFSIPLCASCHRELHRDVVGFEISHGLQEAHILKTLRKASYQGWTMEQIK